jgi:hypothetical protein
MGNHIQSIELDSKVRFIKRYITSLTGDVSGSNTGPTTVIETEYYFYGILKGFNSNQYIINTKSESRHHYVSVTDCWEASKIEQYLYF